MRPQLYKAKSNAKRVVSSVSRVHVRIEESNYEKTRIGVTTAASARCLRRPSRSRGPSSIPAPRKHHPADQGGQSALDPQEEIKIVNGGVWTLLSRNWIGTNPTIAIRSSEMMWSAPPSVRTRNEGPCFGDVAGG